MGVEKLMGATSFGSCEHTIDTEMASTSVRDAIVTSFVQVVRGMKKTSNRKEGRRNTGVREFRVVY